MPLAGSSYVEIYPDAAKEVLDNSEAREFLGRVADAGQKFAESIAPVRTGQYRDSFSSDVVSAGDPEAQVANSDPIWHYLEWGTIHNRPFRVLSQAAQFMGDKVELS